MPGLIAGAASGWNCRPTAKVLSVRSTASIIRTPLVSFVPVTTGRVLSTFSTGFGSALPAEVRVVVFHAELGKPGRYALDHLGAGNHARHLHPAADAHHGNVVVETAAHRQAVGDVPLGVVVDLRRDAVPGLGVEERRGADVLAAGEQHDAHALGQPAPSQARSADVT